MFKEKNIFPMLLKEIEKPFNSDNYIYELKYDGYRAIVYVSNKEVTVRSRNNKDITKLYPELQSLKKLVSKEKVVFDGEIITMDGNRPSFSKLQARSHLKNIIKIKELSLNSPVTFIAFDILYLDKNLTNLDLITRKKVLSNYQDTKNFVKSPIFPSGIELFKQVKKLKLEGIVAKEKESIYLPHQRVNFWLKIKNFQKGYFYVHAYIFNELKYSLYLGEYRGNLLYFVGKISVMPDNQIISKIKKTKRSSNLFVNCHDIAEFIKPVNKVLVKYIERTDNLLLREPFLQIPIKLIESRN